MDSAAAGRRTGGVGVSFIAEILSRRPSVVKENITMTQRGQPNRDREGPTKVAPVLEPGTLFEVVRSFPLYAEYGNDGWLHRLRHHVKEGCCGTVIAQDCVERPGAVLVLMEDAGTGWITNFVHAESIVRR